MTDESSETTTPNHVGQGATSTSPDEPDGQLAADRVQRQGVLGVELGTAFGAGIAGSVLLAAGAVLPVVSGGGAPGFTSWPLLVVLAVLPMLIAAAFVQVRQPLAMAGVLAGTAALAPGRAVLDLQFLADSSASSRPEQFIPNSLVPLPPAAGLWMLLGGHLLTLVAGVLAVRADRVGTDGVADSIGGLGASEESERGPEDGVVPSGRRLDANQRWFAGTLVLGLIAVAGLLMTPFTSDDPYLVTRPAVESPPFMLIGAILLAVSVPLAAGLAVTASSRASTRGCLLGTAAALLAVVLPNVVAGMVVDALRPTPGPIIALVAAAGLAVVALSPAGREPKVEPTDQPVREPRLPGAYWLHVAAGLCAVLAGLAALFGGLAEHVAVPETVTGVDSFTKRMLIPAGLLVGALGGTLLIRPVAALVRPVLSVAWVAILLAGIGSLDTVISATKVSGVQPGSGVLWTSLAMLLAVLAAVACVVAGSVDRDEAGVGDQPIRSPGVIALAPVVAGVLFALGAFGLPAMRASGYVGPDLLANFRASSYGLLLALLAVLVASALAPRCRPGRGAALLIGAACLPGLRVLELPMTGGRIAGTSAGAGTWLSIACAVALLIGAAALLPGPRSRSR
ncbi:MAG: hypothetical protein GEU98_29080 [Pseudonocardiaceae bacterium]|nr:hypothetical protein [Pseudonocardiaceae bacterium]